MPKYSKMSLQKRDELTAKYLSELKAQSREGNSEATRKLNIYSYIDTCGRSSRDQRFYFLSCERLLLMLKCPTEGHDSESEIRGRKFCHQRYWCIACAEDANDRQLKRWMEQVKLSLCRPVECMYLGPLVMLSWPVPNPEAPANLKTFSKYIKQTFIPKIEASGALPGSWMLATSFNPARNQYQALYIGSTVDWSTICVSKKRRNTRSVVAKYKDSKATTDLVIDPHATTDLVIGGTGRGQVSPWKPKLMRSVYLLDDEKNHVIAAEKFFNHIRDGLQWTLGDTNDVFRMTPEQASKFQRRYRNRRLTSTYGMVYGVSNSIGVPGVLTMLVDRKKSDGEIVIETLDPVAVAGVVPSEHSCQIDNDNEDDRRYCHICEMEKRLKLEEDRGYRPRPRPSAAAQVH